jgi:transposase
MLSICTPLSSHKTDIKDSEWIADLLRHGLLKASFIPPKPIRELRDLVRTQAHLIQERSRHINRIHKILETANIKLSSVVTDILGKSARQMLEALITGESDSMLLAKLARGRMRPKIAQLQQARPRKRRAPSSLFAQRHACPSRFSEASHWAVGAGSGRAFGSL